MIIRILEENDAKAYQELRLKALQTNPEAFGSTYEQELNYSAEQVAQRISSTNTKFTLGAFIEDKLIAIVTFIRDGNLKTAHKGNIYGMYVSSEHRGMGVGKRLLKELIVFAGKLEGLEQMNLTVVSDNIAAKKLYEELGFTIFGTEKRALKYSGVYYDEDLMVLEFNNLRGG
ncbi:GNAT family N-acetyltransferase [Paenibacillus shunpengii]|uniref:GNAT family N-acetyltransferase n=1 Tax=Paenibacillus shunpengii TaxID=2054424 RepID=A0ABW5SML0_9BACL|nr:GNAT family N-acetyltransferase [Paenibacillus sp. FSL H7-0326]OMC67445.1 GNAT family N-acetyltransferase [Paenibacillus sp. FSL H7-0326]